MLTIGQFSKVSQISSKTLRYYDEIGLLQPVSVDPINGYRYYDTSQLELTVTILRLKSLEFSLSEIQTVLDDQAQLPHLLSFKKEDIITKLANYASMQSSIEYYLKELSQGGNIMQKLDTSKVKKVTNPELHLISVRENINIAHFDNLFEKASKFLGNSGQIPIGAPVTLYHSEEFTPEDYDVEVGFPVRQDGFSNHTIHSTDCAYYEYTGLYENLSQGYAILTKWIEENNYRINGVPFEQYITDPATVKPEENQVAIYMPITLI